MKKPPPSLAGRWQKVATRDARSGVYPATLELGRDGLYTGTPGDPGHFVVWDVGRYEVESAGRVKLSTANDAEISYKFKLTGDELTVEDGEGAVLRYRRVKEK